MNNTNNQDFITPTGIPHTPNPGSDAAINIGCTCPIYDNCRGNGYMGIEGMFVYNGECPVHCRVTLSEEDKE